MCNFSLDSTRRRGDPSSRSPPFRDSSTRSDYHSFFLAPRLDVSISLPPSPAPAAEETLEGTVPLHSRKRRLPPGECGIIAQRCFGCFPPRRASAERCSLAPGKGPVPKRKAAGTGPTPQSGVHCCVLLGKSLGTRLFGVCRGPRC